MSISPELLRVHVLNVGDGDNIIIEFPEVAGQRKYAIVDCYNLHSAVFRPTSG